MRMVKLLSQSSVQQKVRQQDCEDSTVVGDDNDDDDDTFVDFEFKAGDDNLLVNNNLLPMVVAFGCLPLLFMLFAIFIQFGVFYKK
jgi:hypothetical protein